MGEKRSLPGSSRGVVNRKHFTGFAWRGNFYDVQPCGQLRRTVTPEFNTDLERLHCETVTER